MIRIGDFSRLSRVSIKTLRYYDEVGLLKPAYVDPSTGYRYYLYEQLPRLNRILALKDLGFSLEEIGRLIAEDLTLQALRGMLTLRKAEIQQQLQDASERIARVEARLEEIEKEQSMTPYDVVLKEIDPVKVASVRGVVPLPPQQGRLWHQLETVLAQKGIRPAGPCLSIYHDEEYREKDWDIEVCEPVQEALEVSEPVLVRELPAVESMACVIHHGPFTSIGQAYDSIMKWIAENGYRINGPAREVYLQEARGGRQEDPDTITEIQFPVQKAGSAW
jgi:effector-binding domain-containing protein